MSKKLYSLIICIESNKYSFSILVLTNFKTIKQEI